MKSINSLDKTNVSFWQIFRIIFVIFSLYLLTDVFFRWDGFRYYASFLEFLPNVSFLSLLWTIVALSTTFLIWVPLRASGWLFRCFRWEISSQHLLFFPFIAIPLGLLVWKGKKLAATYIQTTLPVKLIVLLCVFCLAVFLTWLLCNRIERWVNAFQDRITPLVWIFGIFIILSIPITAYRTLWYHTETKELHEVARSSEADKNKPNIILVTFDALTAEDMSLYGYHRDTTPFINEWAKNASLFTKAQAESNFTASTLASLMTGKRVWTHQVYHVRGSKPLKIKTESLPLLLKKNGYYNIAYLTNIVANAGRLGLEDRFDVAPIATDYMRPTNLYEHIDQWLYRYFGEQFRLYDWALRHDFILGDIIRSYSQYSYETAFIPEKAFGDFLDVIDKKSPKPFFAWIHIHPPHDPYFPPEPYRGTFEPSSKLLEVIQGTDENISFSRARYDEFILYCDNQFKKFIRQLEERNMMENSMVMLSSDHGESFSEEHDYFRHGGPHLYEQVTHIPLIIKEPGQTKGRVINDLVAQVDIPATILDLSGIKVAPWMEGRSLKPLLRGKEMPPRIIFSMVYQENPSRGNRLTIGTIAVWEGDYKLIYYLEKKKSLLFNLKQDPYELNNLFDKEPEQGQILLTLIKNNLRKANISISRGE